MPAKLPEGVAKQKVMGFRGTEQEWNEISSFAATRGMSVSEAIRHALRAAGALPDRQTA